MKTKNIFKTLAIAAVLVASCGKIEIANNGKGYELPVTINVTRQGDDPATRATYNESTGKLSFSEGDKLFVNANYSALAGQFAGLLNYDSETGKFSGSIITENMYSGTVEALLADASALMAALIPAGYDSYGYLSFENEGAYDADLSFQLNKAFALTKKEAVEQFSFEYSESYSSGFALAPQNAIVSFTISGLEADTEVAVCFKEKSDDSATPVNVTTDASGVATFAAAVREYDNFSDFYSLTVDGKAIALPDKDAEAGHIYNISRDAAAASSTLDLFCPEVGQVIGSDGKNYDAYASMPGGVTAVAMIAYVDGANGLAIAMADEASTMDWATAVTTAEAHTPVFSNGTWKLPSQDEWKQMFSANGDDDESYSGLNTAITNAGGTGLAEYGYYWSSTEGGGDDAYIVGLYGGGAIWDRDDKDGDFRVRACLVF